MCTDELIQDSCPPHHWLIAETARSIRWVMGTCKKCGESRMFDNWPLADDDWVRKDGQRARAKPWVPEQDGTELKSEDAEHSIAGVEA